jgi:hypothetical protein
MKFADTPKGKGRVCGRTAIAVEEEDQLKVTHFKILVCGVLTYCSWPHLLIQTDI